jgi:hypothetical protein
VSKIKGQRLLRKQIPFFFAFPEANNIDWSIQYQGGGWGIVVNDLGVNYAVWRSYFDIAGWSSEMLTAFIAGAGWQEADEWIMGPPANFSRPRIKTWDIISKAKIGDDALDQHGPGAASQTWLAPGYAGSNYNLEEIFAGRYRHFDFSTTITAGFNQTHESIWGAGDATAGDKIYITRIVQLTGLADYGLEGLTVPPQDVILPAGITTEKDLIYMERLRRSYVAAESRNP